MTTRPPLHLRLECAKALLFLASRSDATADLLSEARTLEEQALLFILVLAMGDPDCAAFIRNYVPAPTLQ